MNTSQVQEQSPGIRLDFFNLKCKLFTYIFSNLRNLVWLHENSPVRLASEVGNSVNGPVVFALGQVEFDSGPNSGGEIGRSAEVESPEFASTDHDSVTDLLKKCKSN